MAITRPRAEDRTLAVLTTQDMDELVRTWTPRLLRQLHFGVAYQRSAGGGWQRVFIKRASVQEEIVQEVWLEFFVQVKRGNFDSSRDPGPYLKRIMVACASRQLKVELNESPTEEVEPPPVVGADAEQGAHKLFVQQLLTELGEPDNQIAVMKFLEGHSEPAIGKKLDLSRDQVARRISFIRKLAFKRWTTDRRGKVSTQ